MAYLDLRFYMGGKITGVVKGVQVSEDCKVYQKMGQGVEAMKKFVGKKRKVLQKVLSELENG